MTPSQRRGERGSVSILIAVLGVAFVVVAGLAIDGGRKLGALAEARDLADGAARAAAQQVDLAAYHATGAVQLDPTAASRAATRYLAASGRTGTITVHGASATVTVALAVPTRILPGPWHVTATETATATLGIEGPRQ